MTICFQLQCDSGQLHMHAVELRKILPRHHTVVQKGAEFFVEIAADEMDEFTAKLHLQRELDRYFFYTNKLVTAKLVSSVYSISCTIRQNVVSRLSDQIGMRSWSDENTARQLRLWALATDTDDLFLKVLLLYQVIELTYSGKYGSSHFPTYDDASEPPNPRTEIRFLRDLVAHAGRIKGDGVKRYCKYLGIEERMFDRVNPEYINLVKSKLPLLEMEARKAICRSLGHEDFSF